MRAVGLTTHIANNNVKSVLLLMGFPLLLAGMFYFFFWFLDLANQYGAVKNSLQDGYNFGKASSYAWETGIEGYGIYALIGALSWFCIAYFIHGNMIQRATGAIPVTRKEYPKIYNMLENLCISRGITMPSFQIIDSPQMNAFASGINEKTYTITLTRGIVEALEDDELEGVIAHELTHIMNRDVRLLIVSIIFVGLISFLAEMTFRTLIRGGGAYRRSSSKNNGGAILILAMIILAIGYVFAILIRFSLSRKREYLADAGAVELTRNPEAMMRALMRIAGHDRIPDMPNEVQQMCIENSHNFMGMFATHPPIDDRIKTLSEMTSTPIPTLTPTERTVPDSPWEDGKPPADADHKAHKSRSQSPWEAN